MGFDVEREAYYRLLMLRKVEEAGIHVSDETVARVAGEFLRNFFRGQPVSMEIFEKNVLNRGGLTTLDFERYIRNLAGDPTVVQRSRPGGAVGHATGDAPAVRA